jgi:hypothetical protein
MVTIKKENGNFVFEVKGIHKFFAFKNKLEIPEASIVSVKQNIETLKGVKGWRFPGTYISSIITAGTFLNNGERNFWDVSNIENCIIIELKNEEYKHFIIEVENPTESIALLKS